MVIGNRSSIASLADIAIVVVVSIVAFLGELAASDHLPWGEETRGVMAVLMGAAAAVAITLGRGGTLADLGFELRPIEQTIEETMRWMYEHGHLSARAAGALAGR